MGILYQDYALFPHLTVAQNIAFGFDRHSAAERDSRVKALLELTGLSEYGKHYPH